MYLTPSPQSPKLYSSLFSFQCLQVDFYCFLELAVWLSTELDSEEILLCLGLCWDISWLWIQMINRNKTAQWFSPRNYWTGSVVLSGVKFWFIQSFWYCQQYYRTETLHWSLAEVVTFFIGGILCCFESLLLVCHVGATFVWETFCTSQYTEIPFSDLQHILPVLLYTFVTLNVKGFCVCDVFYYEWWLRLSSGDVASDWEFAMQLPLFSSSLWSCLFSFCKWWLLWCSIHQDSIDLHKNCLHLKWLAYILPFYEGISTHCATSWSKTSENERNFLISARISFVLS